jgi:DNA-binding transcriptional LysR family regulator
MEDRFAGIREFILTVENGSFTAAAAQLGITGSAVGKSISRLEARLGVQLLHRTTRRIDLTSEGEAYLLSCRRIMEELDQTESFLATGHREPIGRLRIDLPTTFGRRHIVPALLELATRHDRLDLSFTLRDQAVDMVSEGIDMAVRIGALGDSPDLIARRLGEQHMGDLCLSRLPCPQWGAEVPRGRVPARLFGRVAPQREAYLASQK